MRTGAGADAAKDTTASTSRAGGVKNQEFVISCVGDVGIVTRDVDAAWSTCARHNGTQTDSRGRIGNIKDFNIATRACYVSIVALDINSVWVGAYAKHSDRHRIG